MKSLPELALTPGPLLPHQETAAPDKDQWGAERPQRRNRPRHPGRMWARPEREHGKQESPYQSLSTPTRWLAGPCPWPIASPS
jgi:hypothetical protein